MMSMTSLVIILTFFFSTILPLGEGGRHERRLLRDLLTEYDRLERPVMERTDKVPLEFGIRQERV